MHQPPSGSPHSCPAAGRCFLICEFSCHAPAREPAVPPNCLCAQVQPSWPGIQGFSESGPASFQAVSSPCSPMTRPPGCGTWDPATLSSSSHEPGSSVPPFLCACHASAQNALPPLLRLVMTSPLPPAVLPDSPRESAPSPVLPRDSTRPLPVVILTGLEGPLGISDSLIPHSVSLLHKAVLGSCCKSAREQLDGWMGGWVDGWMDEWTDRWMDSQRVRNQRAPGKEPAESSEPSLRSCLSSCLLMAHCVPGTQVSF